MSEGEATTTLASAGFIVVANPVSTSNEAENGIVLSSSPGGKQSPGTTITIDVGVWDGTDTSTTTTQPDTTTTTTTDG
jgi:beta-lactam-binding protein with PASTA domain